MNSFYTSLMFMEADPKANKSKKKFAAVNKKKTALTKVNKKNITSEQVKKAQTEPRAEKIKKPDFVFLEDDQDESADDEVAEESLEETLAAVQQAKAKKPSRWRRKPKAVNHFDSQAKEPDNHASTKKLSDFKLIGSLSFSGASNNKLPGATTPSTAVVPHHFTVYYIFCAMAVATAAALFILEAWAGTERAISIVDFGPAVLRPAPPRVKAPAQVVKGIYLTAYSAANPVKLQEIIELINKTELNAVVIDVKDYTGYVLYDSNIELVNELNTEEDRLRNPRAIIDQLHQHGIYTIARLTVFQDPELAKAKPEWAIKSSYGGLWKDYKGLAWVDPTHQEVWDYNIALAKEAATLGFDEINFDYVRFPSDGNMSTVVYSQKVVNKYDVMADFYGYLSEQMEKEPVWLSLDLFGLVMEKSGSDDMFIGQRLADAVNNADYISPMMYPSHYPNGHLGLDNPAEHPGAVIDNGMKVGAANFVDTRAKVRPWLQAFNIGAVYDAAKMRAQIDAVENYPNAGWLLWNASNRYSSAGLKSVE